MLYSRMNQTTKDKLVLAYRSRVSQVSDPSTAVYGAANEVLTPDPGECWVDVQAAALKALCLMGEVIIHDNPARVLGLTKEPAPCR